MQRPHAILALLLTATVLAVACSGPDTGGPTGPSEADRLRIAVPRDVGPLNIFVGAPEPLAELVYDKLVAPSPYVAEPRPWLATAVRQVDPSTWDVDVRQGVSWHDGKPLTVEDVIFTF